MSDIKRFTSEELLTQLGIEIGKPYLREGKKETVLSINEEHKTFNVKWTNALGEERVDWNTAHYFVNCNITPLPKYTLTETEKHIVLAIDEEWKWIARNYDTTLCVFSDTPRQRKQHWLCWEKNGGYYSPLIPLNHHFQFIQWTDNEPVSLDELREIAKK